jgi:transcription initiation factor TFIID subunit 3
MSTPQLHQALLRPAIIQILRAAGFHSAKPSVIDTLTDIAGRYITLLASRAAFHAFSNHNDQIPDVTDIRLAMSDSGLLNPALTATEEVWRELLRDPISEIPERNGIRRFEEIKRDEEDTQDVTEFIKWFSGAINTEIKRIAGQLPDPKKAHLAETTQEVQDYLTLLKKKHSKTGEESRFQGTVLGIGSEFKPTKIQGGPETLAQWLEYTKQQNVAPLTPPEDTEMTS